MINERVQDKAGDRKGINQIASNQNPYMEERVKVKYTRKLRIFLFDVSTRSYV